MRTYWFETDTLTDDDIREEIRTMVSEALRVQARADGLFDGVKALKHEVICRTVKKAGIRFGDTCILRLHGTETRVRYEGASNGNVCVRPFGKRGQLLKGVLAYDYRLACVLTKCAAGQLHSQQKPTTASVAA